MRLSRFELGESRLASGRVFGSVAIGQVFNQVRTFEHDTAASVLGRGATKVLQEVGFIEHLFQRTFIMDRIFGELNDRTRLDVTPRIDMVSKPGRGGAKGSTCLLYTSPSPRDATLSRMPSSA